MQGRCNELGLDNFASGRKSREGNQAEGIRDQMVGSERSRHAVDHLV